ncbi:MAG: putative Ig domain-containing protein [Bacteroidetes bacterium]|nr:putative Ig domain-containing protein [Bacteroidota bacterium]
MRAFFLYCLFLCPLGLFCQVDFNKGWKMKPGDDPVYAKAACIDQDWAAVSPLQNWEMQGLPQYDGYVWYRLHFYLPRNLLSSSYLKDSVRFLLGPIDDVDACYLNGVKIGQNGHFPDEGKDAYRTAWDVPRRYVLPVNHLALHWDAENVLALRVYDGGGPGGMFDNVERSAGAVDVLDFVKMTVQHRALQKTEKNGFNYATQFENQYQKPIAGSLTVQVFAFKGQKKPLKTLQFPVNIPAKGKQEILAHLESVGRNWVYFEFKEQLSGKTTHQWQETPYVLTPKAGDRPEIHNPAVYGARPGVPFLYKIAASGKAPVSYASKGFPPGVKINAATGVISGTLQQRGMFNITLFATNSAGSDSKTILLVVGDNICLTPPMGWNSWNCWGLQVSDEKVRAAADALLSSGLADYGWNYINIDDGWEAPGRNAQTGAIETNEKFPNMPALSDYLHKKGFKMGIYSSPGPKTCGNFLGSYQHEAQDAQTWADWGVDYLKYDWCSYSGIAPEKPDLEAYKHPYAVMRAALNATNRDIVYSMCQYGMGDVWHWGEEVGGNLWRTTGDITDTWESMSGIGFSQDSLHSFARPGHWNDPDMLVVGHLGWSEQLHPSRLTPSEQYTHISLWAMLSAPLLIGCDLTKIDDFTFNLLANDEVLAIDQDHDGRQAEKKQQGPDYEIWVKALSDGSQAIAIFNRSEQDRDITTDWAALGLANYKTVRDVWQQKDIGKFGKTWHGAVYGHGVRLLRVY